MEMSVAVCGGEGVLGGDEPIDHGVGQGLLLIEPRQFMQIPGPRQALERAAGHEKIDINVGGELSLPIQTADELLELDRGPGGGDENQPMADTLESIEPRADHVGAEEDRDLFTEKLREPVFIIPRVQADPPSRLLTRRANRLDDASNVDRIYQGLRGQKWGEGGESGFRQDVAPAANRCWIWAVRECGGATGCRQRLLEGDAG